MEETRIGSASELVGGKLIGVGGYVVGKSQGAYFAVSRRCRHLGADLARGSVDREGCLVCPLHASRYNVENGRMVRGPQGIYAKIPGLGAAYKLLTMVIPLRRAQVTEREGILYLES
ncbi:MAG TPA: Rieske 2Fe-2S domain-containing protein [Actinomycetota bacterium]|nr:Rieske 2Fe-2S domain-containing protein [Actinomycetota bacterium]